MVSQTGVISEWANDTQRFLLEHFDTIQDSPSHIYHSALPLSPPTSWLYKHYIAEAPSVLKVITGLSAGWGVCSRTTLLDSPAWNLWHHNDTIVVGSESGDIILLNAITGSQSTVLSGHTGEVICVVFSPDGTSLVSGSWDKTVKLWDVQTGGAVKTFLGHTGAVLSVSISADCTTTASGSDDGTICLWGIQTGECYHTIQQQQTVNHVAFSPKDPQCFLSISGEKFWQWDTNGCQIRPPFDGLHVAFSPDGAQLVSCFEQTITVHDSSSGTTVTKFQVADNSHLCCFSPDNSVIAVATFKIACCWDITTTEPQLVETFIGHTEVITSLIYPSSSTLISASEDNSVKFWQIGAQSIDPPIDNLQSKSHTSASIEYVTLESKEGIVITGDSEGIIKTWDISTGICKISFQAPAKEFHMGDIKLVNGKLLFVWYLDEKIHMWDVESRELLWEVDVPWNDIDDLEISGDGFMVFSLYTSDIWAWSLWTGELVGSVEIEYEDEIGDKGGSEYERESGSLKVDGSKVWTYWPESNCKGWDFGVSNSHPIELSNMSIPSPNGLWDPEQASIKNPDTGEVVFQLSGRFVNSSCIQCDDSYLVAGYESGAILILNLANVK